jgi:ParB family transcriptional regulator, chromosome partitioning protein
MSVAAREMAMAEDAGRSRLGRGLAALIGDAGDESSALERLRSQRKVPIEFLRPNPRNPRREFGDAELDELAASIRERGIIQPILVRGVRGAADAYEIIAGERRWRAAQRAGLHDVPVALLEVGDRESLEIAIIENVQRTDLNPLEEAMGYGALMEEFGYGQDEVAKIVGKSRPHVANTLRLLKLSDKVKAYISSGKLTAGHARMLVGQPNAEEFAEQIVARGLNVRQVENLARESGKKQKRETKRTGRIAKDADTEAVEKRLSDSLGLAVTIEHHADGSGLVQVHYRTLEQLDEVIRRLEKAPAGAGEGDGPRVRGL